ncbi:MAG: acyltransferase family protein [Muribaculum sp.]|nr:acyltransferase family protein [Muribaculum sp.]
MNQINEMEKAPNNERIEWIDIAKGMSIILFVFGHSFLARIPYVGDWFASFLIPFFFFVSGLLYNPKVEFGRFIKKKWSSLIRPFLIFSLIVLIGYFGLGYDEGMHRLVTMPYGWGGYALWFIPVLFITNLLYYLICRIWITPLSRAMAISILCICGYITYRIALPNYWNLNFALSAVFFYGLGNIVQPVLTGFFSGSMMKVSILAFWALLISSCYLFNDKPEFFVNYLGGGILTHIVGIAGAVLMCCLALMLSKITHPQTSRVKFIFKYFGKNSYVVLAFHQIIILLFITLIPGMPKALVHILMWVILILLIEIITRKFPFTLGRKAYHPAKHNKCGYAE